jgi:hypothetical protein
LLLALWKLNNIEFAAGLMPFHNYTTTTLFIF